MKILLLGDYSGCHANLAKGLRKLGHTVTLVSDGCGFMNVEPDVMLARKPGLTGSIGYLLSVLKESRKWRGYDVVQLINPHFLNLRPGKLRRIFDRLRRQNKSVYVTLCSEDTPYVDALLNRNVFRYSEAKVGDTPTRFYTDNPHFFDDWLLPETADYQQYFFDKIDGMMAVLPEYAMGVKPGLEGKLFRTGIPVDLEQIAYKPAPMDRPVCVMLAYKTSQIEKKGAYKLERILRELEDEMPDKMELMVVHDVPFEDFLDGLTDAHLLVDQLYAYAPATAALNALATGVIPLTGCEPEYAEWLGEDGELPVYPLRPTDDLKTKLRDYILDTEKIKRLRTKTRKLVEKNNEMTVVAQKFVDAWNRKL
ncbi:MAG: hypothetical protein K2O00_01765 [Muribaculaceae bacterium]|nr:hypothetical protein [Muribaculaceae bacterium]